MKKYQRIKYHVSPHIKILFVGINPSLGTYKHRVPFSGNKSFWYHLSDSGLIDETKEQLKDNKFLKHIYDTKFNQIYHYGLTNLIDRPSRSIADLKSGEEISGIKRVLRIIKKYKPPIVCFVGKTTYEKFIGKKVKTLGWKTDIDSSKIFVMHSPLHGLASVRIAELKKVEKVASKSK